MRDLWLKNRKFFIRSRPEFPSQYRENNMKSFVRFREGQLRYRFPSHVLEKMTDAQKEGAFSDYFKGRKVYHYNHRVENGKVIMDESYKILPKGKLSNMRGRIREEVREALLVKPGPACHLIGTVPFKYGAAPAKVRKMDNRFFDYLTSDQGREFAHHFDPKYNERISVPGVWSTQWQDFQRCGQLTNNSPKYDELIDAIKTRFKKGLKLPYISEEIDSDDCYMVETNSKAQCGLMSGKCFGRTHAKADKYLRPLAAEMFKLSGERTVSDVSLWTLGGRERRQKLNKDAPLRGRIIMMPDGVPKIVGLTYASKIYDALGKINYGNFDNECQIGRNDFHGNYVKFVKAFKDPDRFNVLEADISQHDANTSEETMVVAFGLLRSCFPPDSRIDRRFLYMMSGTIFKNVVVPGRFIYKLLKSIPSGSPWTSILTTIVNWLNWSVVISKNFRAYANEFKLNLFGDDTIVLLPNKCRWDATRWSMQFRSQCGYALDPCEIKTFFARDWRNRPSFLKTIPNYDLPARLLTDHMLSVSFTRKRNRRNYCAYAQQATVSCYAAPFSFTGIDMALKLREYCYKQYFSNQGNLAAINQQQSINRRNRITYKLLSVNYLVPRIYGIEYVKNVDLGNKPKTVQFGTNVTFRGVPIEVFGWMGKCLD